MKDPAVVLALRACAFALGCAAFAIAGSVLYPLIGGDVDWGAATGLSIPISAMMAAGGVRMIQRALSGESSVFDYARDKSAHIQSAAMQREFPATEEVIHGADLGHDPALADPGRA